jgi:hypothetical protein
VQGTASASIAAHGLLHVGTICVVATGSLQIVAGETQCKLIVRAL